MNVFFKCALCFALVGVGIAFGEMLESAHHPRGGRGGDASAQGDGSVAVGGAGGISGAAIVPGQVYSFELDFACPNRHLVKQCGPIKMPDGAIYCVDIDHDGNLVDHGTVCWNGQATTDYRP